MRSLPGPPEAQPRRTPSATVIGPSDHDRTGRSCATHAPAAPLRSQFHTPARCSALPCRFAAMGFGQRASVCPWGAGRSEPCGSRVVWQGRRGIARLHARGRHWRTTTQTGNRHRLPAESTPAIESPHPPWQIERTPLKQSRPPVRCGNARPETDQRRRRGSAPFL